VALQLQIARRAAAQIEKADAWWLDNRPAAPEAFREDLKAAFALLALQPGVGSKVSSARLDGVRRLHLGRIRYYLFYRVKDQQLVVLSVWHTSRGAAPVL
jgi:plasmid stabilization system protein ParE